MFSKDNRLVGTISSLTMCGADLQPGPYLRTGPGPRAANFQGRHIKKIEIEVWYGMMGCKNTESCKKLFLNLKILPLPSQYIFSLLLFVIRNENQFPVNSTIHNFDTRQHTNFHQPSVNVTKFQKGVSNLGAKVFNMLPSYIKIESDNPKKFKFVLQKFLYKNSFNSLDEYFQFRKVKN